MARPLGNSHVAIDRPDLGLTFGKSTRSNIQNCVFAAEDENTVHILDSKDKHGPTLAFSKAAFTAFIANIR